MVWHSGQQWKFRHLHRVLESSTTIEKRLRDTWLANILHATQRAHEPISRTLPYSTQQLFQRKVATYRYNQFGLEDKPFHKIAHIDRLFRHPNVPGTRGWVPVANHSCLAFHRLVKGASILVHRVYWRGYGTDPSLQRGKWAFRWKKTLTRNSFQYTRS